MAQQSPLSRNPSPDTRGESAANEQDEALVHGATAVEGSRSHDRQARRRALAGGFIGALAATITSAVFVVSFIGGLHSPGPRSVPVGIVGHPTLAVRIGTVLKHQRPGAYTTTAYTSQGAARTAIGRRSIDAALVPGLTIDHLLVATAVSEAETTAIIKTSSAVAAKARVPLIVQNIRPLHSGDPQGLSQVFFITALLSSSLTFGNQLISRIGPRLREFWHLAMITVYAVIIAAVATAIADGLIGALTGAPWAVFGIGALLAFAAAAMGAAATRWAGGVVYLVVLLLFVPVGISSSGTTLGPHMITQWYADLGKALLPGSAQPAIRNVTYFNGNVILGPLLVLSAWALAGVTALIMAAVLHPPMRGQSRRVPRNADASQPVQTALASPESTTQLVIALRAGCSSPPG